MGFPTYFKILSKYFPLTNLESEIFNIDKNIMLNRDIPESDKYDLLKIDIIVCIYRSSLILDNLIITSQYNRVHDNKIYFFPIQLLDKTVEILNSITQHEGRFLSTNHPMDLYLGNSTFDFYKSQEGFYLNLS